MKQKYLWDAFIEPFGKITLSIEIESERSVEGLKPFDISQQIIENGDNFRHNISITSTIDLPIIP